MEATAIGTMKTCPQCGATFSCNPGGCWCSALPPVMPMIEHADCYCPACLNAIIAAKISAIQ